MILIKMNLTILILVRVQIVINDHYFWNALKFHSNKRLSSFGNIQTPLVPITRNVYSKHYAL